MRHIGRFMVIISKTCGVLSLVRFIHDISEADSASGDFLTEPSKKRKHNDTNHAQWQYRHLPKRRVWYMKHISHSGQDSTYHTRIIF
jgi:hypothetical protein